MRGSLTGAAAAAAALWMMAPQKRGKCSPFAPAEMQTAAKDALRRLSLDCRKSAMVISLWAERPARQCAVTPRYVLAEDKADFGFGGVLRFAAVAPPAAAPAGARALLARLQAAGYAASDAEAAVFMAPESPRDGQRRAA